MNARFTVGQRVKQPGTVVGNYPPGIATIATIDGQMVGQEFTYKVKCIKTGNEIPQIFRESQLAAVTEEDDRLATQDENARQLREGDAEKRARGEETPPVSEEKSHHGAEDGHYKEPTTA